MDHELIIARISDGHVLGGLSYSPSVYVFNFP